MHSPHIQQKLLLGSCFRPTMSGRSCGGSQDRHATLAFCEETSSILMSEPGKLSCSGAIGPAMQDGLLRDGCCLTGSLEYSHPMTTCGSAGNMQRWPYAKPLPTSGHVRQKLFCGEFAVFSMCGGPFETLLADQELWDQSSCICLRKAHPPVPSAVPPLPAMHPQREHEYRSAAQVSQNKRRLVYADTSCSLPHH